MRMTRRSLMSNLGQGLGLGSALGAVGAVLAGCNTLSLFNSVTPKDAGTQKIATNIAFGPGPRQTYDLYAPIRIAPTTSLPVLAFFYGGGWNSGAKEDYAWMGRSLAALGYLVAIADYRLVPEVTYPSFLEDNAAAIRHLLGQARTYGGDPDRLATAGHSAGAYAAVMMALDSRYLGIDAAGRSPVTACVGISGPYDFYPFDVPESRNAFGTALRPEETQPVTYARKTNTSFLLMQSRADKIVGLKNAVSLSNRLKGAGSDVTLKLYDGLSHQDMAAAFSLPFRGKAPLRADMATFLAAKL